MNKITTFFISIVSLIAFVPILIVLGYMVVSSIILFLPILLVAGVVMLLIKLYN